MHRLVRGLDHLSSVIAAALAAFAIYVAGFGFFDEVWVSGLTVVFAVSYGLAFWRPTRGAARPLVLLNALLLILFVALIAQWIHLMDTAEGMLHFYTLAEDISAWVAMALIGYVTWLFFGLPIMLVILAAAAYLLLPFAYGEDWIRAAENLWYSQDGVFGRPVEVVGRTVLIYMVLGAVLHVAGAGETVLRLAFAATGRLPGGPAHAAVGGSALFGTMSGAAVANVVSTGVFTIPVIKRVGFKPAFAGGVEAAASTGGQIMPPVMGAVAFFMADVTGISYLQIIVAATIPALMYYASLFAIVHVEAKRKGIAPLPASERIRLTRLDLVRSSVFVLPLALIVAVLLTGRTAQHAGAWATGAAFLLSLVLFPAYRNPRRWWDTLVNAGRSSAVLMIAVAAIGFVVGTVNMTGVGVMLAEKVLTVSGSSLALSLVMVMFASLFLGMGLPTGATYLIIAIILGPALAGLGVPLLAAHLFVLYFGVLSDITPPVALAAFAAAPIAGAKPMETGFAGVRLAAAGFIIPFVFVYHPDILLIAGEFSLVGVAWACGAFALSTWGLVTGIGGWEVTNLGFVQRAVRIVAGIGVLFIDPLIALPAAALLIGATLARRMATQNTKQDTTQLSGRTTP